MPLQDFRKVDTTDDGGALLDSLLQAISDGHGVLTAATTSWQNAAAAQTRVNDAQIAITDRVYELCDALDAAIAAANKAEGRAEDLEAELEELRTQVSEASRKEPAEAPRV